MSAVALSARDLVGCEHRTALDARYRDVPVRAKLAPGAERRIEAALIHRRRVRDMLRSLHNDSWFDVDSWFNVAAADDTDGRDTMSERISATAAALSRGVRWIWNPVFPSDQRSEVSASGAPEAIVSVAGGYVPVIVVNHRITNPVSDRTRAADSVYRPPRTSPLWSWMPVSDPTRTLRSLRRDQLRMAHLRSLMVAADISGPPLAGCIGLDADCIVVSDLTSVEIDYNQTFGRRRAIALGEIGTRASRVSECRGCRWWETSCRAQLTDARDVSLVVNGQRAGLLRERGIATIDQLAQAPPAPDNWGDAEWRDAVVTARAWLADIPLVRRVRIPEVIRADVEVDVDMESHGDDGAYLWGTLLTDTTDPAAEALYRPFVTWDPLPTRDEGRVFAEFWIWLMSVRDNAHKSGKTFAAYCYSQSAENRWLRFSAERFADIDGVPAGAEVEEFIESNEWHDVFEWVGKSFISPRGKGLKVIAPAAGFSWRDAEAGGEASMQWYRRAVGLVDYTDVSQRHRLLRYNEDDVRATKALREWMASPGVTEVVYRDKL